MWCVVPAPISAASSAGSRERSGASLVEEPRVQIRVAEGDHVVQRAASRPGTAAAAARPDPRTSFSAVTAGVTSPIDSSVPRPSRPRSARGHSKNVISVPGRADLVTEVQVIAVRVVEVDRLLDEREPELVAVEVERPLRVAAHARDVMEARRAAWRESRGLREQAVQHDRVREEQHRDHAVSRVRFRSTMCVPPCDVGVKPMPPKPGSRPECIRISVTSAAESRTWMTEKKASTRQKG